MLRVEENCLEVTAFTPEIMRDSQIALLAVEGNVFDLKAFHNLEGYDDVSLWSKHFYMFHTSFHLSQIDSYIFFGIVY